jgi:hypothetical protein
VAELRDNARDGLGAEEDEEDESGARQRGG